MVRCLMPDPWRCDPMLIVRLVEYLLSTLRRVHLPPIDDSYVNDGVERKIRDHFSIPYFVVPRADTLMEFLEVCCSKKSPKNKRCCDGKFFYVIARSLLLQHLCSGISIILSSAHPILLRREDKILTM